jgi:N-acetylglutamate synthase-like GNAT family acetyltransferase
MRHLQEAVEYIRQYRGETFVLKLSKDVAEAAEEVGLIHNIEVLRGVGLRIVVAHALPTFNIAGWPGLAGMMDKRGVKNIFGIDHSLRKDRIAVVFCGAGQERTSDELAAHLAVSLRAYKLLFITDSDGVKDAHGLLMNQMTIKEAQKLLTDGQFLTTSMRDKLKAAAWAFEHNVDRVHIVNGLKENALLIELLTSEGIGTMIYGHEPYVDIRKAKKADCPTVIDLIRSGDFSGAIDLNGVSTRISSFRVRTYDDSPHGCMLFTVHKEASALEIAYAVTSRIYEDAPDTEVMVESAINYAREHQLRHIFMEAAKTQIWLGIYPWFLGLGFKRRHLRDVLPGEFPGREDSEVWYLGLF